MAGTFAHHEHYHHHGSHHRHHRDHHLTTHTMSYENLEAKRAKEVSDAKKGSSWMSKRLGAIRNFVGSVWAIATSDGSQPGVEVDDPADEIAEDPTKDKLFGAGTQSIWSEMLKTSPSVEEIQNIVRQYNHIFHADHGYDMMFERDCEGRTVLHVALLHKHMHVINYLLEDFEGISDLVNLVIENQYYWGEHPCHIAVVKFGDDIEILRRLIAKGADVHCARAMGSFFDGEGDNYMGETVLAFAAYMGHSNVVRYLVEEVKVDPNILDSYGNNVLHVLAYWGYATDQREAAVAGDVSVDSAFADPSTNFTTEVSTTDGNDAEQQPTVSQIKKHPQSSDPVVSGIYEYLSIKTTVKSQNEFASLSDAEKNEYKRNLMTKADDTLANAEGMTPFIVAVSRRQGSMVKALLEYKAVTLWEFGQVSQKQYNLSEIDTYIEKETMNHTKGALEIAVKNEDIEIITSPLFLKLLDAKWTLYGRMIFLTRFAMNLVYMVLFSAAIGLLPNGSEFYVDPNKCGWVAPSMASPVDNSTMGIASSAATESVWIPCKTRLSSRWSYFDEGNMAIGISRFVIEVILLLCNVYAIGREFKEMSVSVMNYFRGFGNQENFAQWIGIMLFFTCVVMRAFNLNEAENTFLGLTTIFGWLSLLYFSKGSPHLGPLGVIFFRIIKTDLIKFLFLISVFLIGFSQALYLQMAPYSHSFLEANGTTPDTSGYGTFRDWSTLYGSLVWGIRYVYGQGSYDDIRNAPNQFSLFIFLIFVLIATILLVNMFIAMLSSTFGKVYDNAEDVWRVIWATAIMEMDERINAEYRKMIARKKKEGLSVHVPPITRIGVPRTATLVKPFKHIADAESKLYDLAGGAKTHRKRNKHHGPKVSQSDTQREPSHEKKNEVDKRWNGYIYDFILQMRSGITTRIIATNNPRSPLYENRKIKSRTLASITTRRS